MTDIRIGLFGLGHRGVHWLRLLQRIPGYKVTAIGDIFEALHERGAADLVDPRGVAKYARYEDMLADPNVDAIALTVRCKEQGAMAAQALEAGKHVSAEVPAAHTMEDCWRIVVAQERSGLVYQLGEQSRYAGFFQAWRDMVQQGRLGRIVYFEGEYVSYKGILRYHQDWSTGQFVYPSDLDKHPNAKRTWIHEMDPIHYLVHELSPVLMVLDDRVTTVTAMGTRRQSYAHPELKRADIQVALMKTEKDTILRMMQGGTQMLAPARDHHHYQVVGTEGSIESGRSYGDRHYLWMSENQMHGPARVDWKYERTDAPAGGCGQRTPGHGLLRARRFPGRGAGRQAAQVRCLQGDGHGRAVDPGVRLDRLRGDADRRAGLQAERVEGRRGDASGGHGLSSRKATLPGLARIDVQAREGGFQTRPYRPNGSRAAGEMPAAATA